MADSIGNNLKLTVFGSSHGPYVGATLDGLPAGIKINLYNIRQALNMRKPVKEISTSRKEEDVFKIISGVYNDYTSGDTLTIIIQNNDIRAEDYKEFSYKPRPSHADYVSKIKYSNFNDFRGGGHFSGRLTAPIVAVCSILKDALQDKGIVIASRIKTIKDIKDRDFNYIANDIKNIKDEVFPVLDLNIKKEMISLIKESKEKKDSVGGILETVILGIPCGVGEPYFNSIESVISSLLFSVGGIKGVEFGDGFAITEKYGSQANDCFTFSGEKIVTSTNHNGGINGGITNGMPIIFRTAVKPTPSIGLVQKTVDLNNNDYSEIQIKGRHDPCIVHRVRPAVEALTAFGIADLCIECFGKEWLKK